MNLVFCTTCKERTQHIAQTLPANLRDNARARFVVLDYNDSGELLRYLRGNHLDDIESGRLAVYSMREQGVNFRMAHAKNMAHRAGLLEGADLLCNLDADNFTGLGFDDYLLEQFAANPGGFMWARMIKDGAGRLPRGISGRIAVTSAQYLNVGGYNERFNVWGPDDKDFNIRLRRLGYSMHEIDARFLKAIFHTDKMRFKEYKVPETESDSGDAVPLGPSDFDVDESGETVANFGTFGTGVVFKNFDWECPIPLNPLPTRIFGIGAHKTATTSLHHALSILGVDSAHWKSAHWAKAIWEEMRTWGRSLTLEKSYALCDLPIPMMFRALDSAYPGSKFILTLRDEKGWIESVENHWNPERNKFRESWNHDPFTHRCHTLLYGHRNFNRDSMLNQYRRHNAEVLDHFKERPGDLLIMDMDRGAGWRELCGFLGRPIPGKPYPRAYASY
jgi:hypothetical protein